jgi:hypothetical protein
MKKVLGYSEKEYMIYRKKHAKQTHKKKQKNNKKTTKIERKTYEKKPKYL